MPDRKGIKDKFYDLLLNTPSVESVNKSLHVCNKIGFFKSLFKLFNYSSIVVVLILLDHTKIMFMPKK